MKLTLERDLLLQTLQTATKFTSDKLTAANALQGVNLDIQGNQLHVYATDLNAFYHGLIPLDTRAEEINTVIEPRKVIEFIQLLQSGEIVLELDKTQLRISQGKTKGVFPLIATEEFPLPPELDEKEVEISRDFFKENLPFILFTASNDEARPVLTGINFVAGDEELIIVSTDGFRLSLLKEKKAGTFESMIIPAQFLQEVIRNLGDAEKVSFIYSKKENIVLFRIGNEFFYSRLIEGEFPPFERVIPSEKKATAVMNKDDFLRSTRLISIFARDYSNVVVCEFGKGEVTIRPKKEANRDNTTTQDIEYEGEDVTVAFNFKYLLDFLNNIDSEQVTVELLRSDAPVVFRPKGKEQFLHIIMPIRIQE